MVGLSSSPCRSSCQNSYNPDHCNSAKTTNPQEAKSRLGRLWRYKCCDSEQGGVYKVKNSIVGMKHDQSVRHDKTYMNNNCSDSGKKKHENRKQSSRQYVCINYPHVGYSMLKIIRRCAHVICLEKSPYVDYILFTYPGRPT